jgi:hypothetical protein
VARELPCLNGPYLGGLLGDTIESSFVPADCARIANEGVLVKFRAGASHHGDLLFREIMSLAFDVFWLGGDGHRTEGWTIVNTSSEFGSWVKRFHDAASRGEVPKAGWETLSQKLRHGAQYARIDDGEMSRFVAGWERTPISPAVGPPPTIHPRFIVP